MTDSDKWELTTIINMDTVIVMATLMIMDTGILTANLIRPSVVFGGPLCSIWCLL
jgi:hypothetical protein